MPLDQYHLSLPAWSMDKYDTTKFPLIASMVAKDWTNFNISSSMFAKNFPILWSVDLAANMWAKPPDPITMLQDTTVTTFLKAKDPNGNLLCQLAPNRPNGIVQTPWAIVFGSFVGQYDGVTIGIKAIIAAITALKDKLQAFDILVIQDPTVQQQILPIANGTPAESFTTVTDNYTSAGSPAVAATLIPKIDPTHWVFGNTLYIYLDGPDPNAIVGDHFTRYSYFGPGPTDFKFITATSGVKASVAAAKLLPPMYNKFAHWTGWVHQPGFIKGYDAATTTDVSAAISQCGTGFTFQDFGPATGSADAVTSAIKTLIMGFFNLPT